MDDTESKNEEKTEAPVVDDKQRAEDYLNNWKRERADFLNYKKDEAKRIEEFVKFANEDVILEVVELVDDLENAAKEIKNSGLNQVINKFDELFKKYKVDRIPVEGKEFDPSLHEAIETEKDGTKLIEVRAGYTMHGRVVRPARVKIVK